MEPTSPDEKKSDPLLQWINLILCAGGIAIFVFLACGVERNDSAANRLMEALKEKDLLVVAAGAALMILCLVPFVIRQFRK